MRKLQGTVKNGVRDFSKRINCFPKIFKDATGVDLFPGTINVDVGEPITINEDFRIEGSKINEPDQDLIFERCKINGFSAFRIRPFNKKNGGGGHGDHVLEISCEQKIPNITEGSYVEITLFN